MVVGRTTTVMATTLVIHGRREARLLIPIPRNHFHLFSEEASGDTKGDEKLQFASRKMGSLSKDGELGSMKLSHHANGQRFLSENRGKDPVDLPAQLWYECAGLTVKVPRVDDMVFYFPQGHLEQVDAYMKQEGITDVPSYGLPSRILCKVVDVLLKAEADTDEVFAEISLVPNCEVPEGPTYKSIPRKVPASSFRKKLTPSDVSKQGGCSLHRRHVDATFPPLDMSRGTASQELVVKDLHGGVWNFHHTCHGRPKRNLLTSGWGKFVSAKRLMAGDTCIFLRGRNELYIGVQRAVRLQKPSTDLFGVTMQHGILVTALDAISRRAKFKVYYHPRTSPSRFLVAYDEFIDSLDVNYSPNMNVEMLFDGGGGGGEDPMQNLKRFSGIIIGKEDIDSVRWPHSEWRSLKVRWDATTDGHVLPERVSPWSIQSVDLAAQDQQSFVSLGRKRSMPFEPTNFRSSKTNGVGHKYKLFGVEIWDGKSGVCSRHGTSWLSISKGTLKQQSQNYSVVTAHRYIKVLKHGTALGRSVDLSCFIGYEGLIGELDKMFEFFGTLVSGTSGCVVTYADGYGNKMLLGDRLWSQFKAVVRKMTIESAAAVN
ncbi:hypothetical protein L6452_38295 [Arctium lappa]|uniref:Uncharacterized protein n=1 Tax=Arctium lappa TaxID=4217 RepID=A0ACB8Y6G8_ARCLA|nr:hypothetical protein L6452_38295 [Arctium lappa]